MEKWKKFPPTDDDAARLRTYSEFRKLMKGEHEGFFLSENCSLSTHERKNLYVAVNFAGTVSKLCADLLFGETPVFTVPDEAAQSALNDIVCDNNLQTICHTMAMSSSYRGDCVFKTRFGKSKEWDESPYPIIESVPSSYFFPDINPDNVMGMSSAAIAWTRKIGSQLYLRREIHYPGRIINELFKMNSEHNVGEQVSLSSVEEYSGLEEVQDTKYPGLLVEYVPNWRLDDSFWGVSDYFDSVSLMEELNSRVTRIKGILNRHSEPKLLLPPGIMEYDERLQRWYVRKEDLDALEVEPSEAGDLPRYLTWDAQLSACFDEIDKLLDFLMLVTETSPSALGFTKRDGGMAESGKALRFRLMRTIGKINRKKRFFDQALKNVLYAAQVLNAVHGGAPAPQPVTIEWADGLPNDPQETADVINSRVTAGTMSRRRALEIDGLSGKDLEDELGEIASEHETATPESPSITLPGLSETE